jgi:DNA mismatch repair protein MutS2
VESLHKEMDSVRKDLMRARQPLEALKIIEKQIFEVEEKISAPVERRESPVRHRVSTPKLGERVKLRSLQMEGIVTSIGENDVEVQVGSLRVRSKLNDLLSPIETPAEAPAVATGKKQSASINDPPKKATPFQQSPGMEIDLRGQRAEDALDALDRYLSNAYMVGLPFVRIIHGKGTGRLRQVIREALKASEVVSSFEEGGEKEGGEGVTIAHLSQS